MNQIVAPSADVVFRDALGERRRMIDSAGHEVELLCLSAELSNAPGFEPALTRRVSRLADFRHSAYPNVHGVERFDPARLAVVSDAVHGVRLSRLLASVADKGIAVEIGAALCVTRQILSAIDALHAFERDVAHGALGPERIVINSSARVVVVEQMLGPALEQLRYSHQHYWKSLRIALPRSAGVTKFDQRVDVTQIGAIALALLLGRMLADDEYSAKLADLVNSMQAPSGGANVAPLKPALREWLLRSIQFDPHHSFSSPAEAGAALDSMQSDDERAAGLASFERVLMRHHGIAPAPIPVKPVVAPAPVEPPAPPVATRVETPMPAPVVVPHPVAATPVVVKPVVAPTPVEPPPAAPIAMHIELPAPIHVAAPSTVSSPAALAPPFTPAVAGAPPFTPAVAAVPPFTSAVAVPAPAPHAPRAAAEPSRRSWQHVAAALVVLGLLTAGGMFALRRRAIASGLAVQTGTLTVQSNPSGAQLDVDGKSSGFTPATLSVAQGTHTIVLRGVGEPKTMTVTVAAGAQVSQYIEFAKSVPTTGGLLVRTEPAGALVTIDRVSKGASPATIANLAPGDHTVTVSSDGVSIEQIVTVEPGVTTSLVVPLSGRDKSLLSGWVAVAAPIDIQIFESGKLLGTNQTDRVMMSSGQHHLDFVNDALGYHASRTLSVGPGKVEAVSLKVPSGSIAVNAVPWAEVWIDGEKAGDTPIGNLQTTIGRHDVVFRHPELGETRQSVTVTLLSPARLSVDMRKK